MTTNTFYVLKFISDAVFRGTGEDFAAINDALFLSETPRDQYFFMITRSPTIADLPAAGADDLACYRRTESGVWTVISSSESSLADALYELQDHSSEDLWPIHSGGLARFLERPALSEADRDEIRKAEVIYA